MIMQTKNISLLKIINKNIIHIVININHSFNIAFLAYVIIFVSNFGKIISILKKLNNKNINVKNFVYLKY